MAGTRNKVQKNVIKFFKTRVLLVGTLIALQAVILMVAVWEFGSYLAYFYSFCGLLSIVVVLFLVSNRRSNPAYKIALIIPILVFPVFGGLFYIIFGRNQMAKGTLKSFTKFQARQKDYFDDDQELIENIRRESKSIYSQYNYIFKNTHYPVYNRTETNFLPVGEEFFESLKSDLKNAQRYIFLEYFIIQEGKMWNDILDILIEKVKEGIDVRVIYDDIGSVQLLPSNYFKYLRSVGIKCQVFNRFNPVVSMWHNNRDHRKITVIDGKIAYTGGINLADEYINHYDKHGHWKDCGVSLKGDAAWSFTVMFLSLWCTMTGEEEDFEDFRATKQDYKSFKSDGYVAPYDDVPTDNETVGENVYLNMINKAHNYVYISTPYFIVDNETVTSLCLAAKSGIDVRIVTPGHGDKWYVHLVTRSYYKRLIENGVKLYEYTPGFIHAKTMVCDDLVGIVGTINFDYRSMYLHLECAALMYKSRAVTQVRDDYINNIITKSHEITLEDCYALLPWYKKLIAMILEIFAPLM